MRWLLLGLGLAIAGGGLVALVAGTGAPPLDQIDEDSRDQLERLLRAHDGADGPRAGP